MTNWHWFMCTSVYLLDTVIFNMEVICVCETWEIKKHWPLLKKKRKGGMWTWHHFTQLIYHLVIRLCYTSHCTCSVLIYPLTSAMPSADGSPLSRNQAKKLRLTRPSCRFRSFPTSASVRAVRFIPFFQSIFVDFDSGSPGNNIKGVKTKSQEYACCICQVSVS